MAVIDRHEPGTPSWVDLMTPDLDRARAFYGALFGWEFEVGGPETGHYTMCKLRGRFVAGMGKLQEGAPFPPSWSVYFAVENVDATSAKIRERGGQVVMGPMDVMNEGRLAFCADPTGAHFGLWQPLRHPGATLVAEPGAMAWHEVNTREVEAARDFYSAVFGLVPEKLPELNYYTLQKGDKPDCGIMHMGADWPADLPPHWMNYFAVANTDAAAAKIKELGGRVVSQPFDTPYGRIAIAADPSGATFSIIQLPASA